MKNIPNIASIFITATLVTLVGSSFSFGEEGERRRIIESLFRSVIESHLDRENRGNAPVRARPINPGEIQGRTQSPVPARVIPVDSRMVSYRKHITGLATESAHLADHLNRYCELRGVRPLIPAAIKLKTSCKVLQSHCERNYGFNQLATQYQAIDSEWRNLHYQLRSLNHYGQFDANTRTCIGLLDQHATGMCQLLGITQQFDRYAVLRNCHAQVANFDSLLDAVDYELQHQKECQSLLSQGRRMKEQLLRLEPIILHAPYEQVISQYSKYNTDCRKYCATLYPLRKPSIDRCLSRVREGSNSVFRQLRVEPTIDRLYLAYVSESMGNYLGSLFKKMTVAQLVALPPADQQAILKVGNQLKTRCRNYCSRVQGNAPLRELAGSYVAINNEWTKIGGICRKVKDPVILSHTRSIDGYCNEIRDVLGVRSRYDQKRALALAASLEGMSENMYALSGRYGRYCRSTALRTQLANHGNDFFELSCKIHQQVAAEAEFAQIQDQCNKLLTTWQGYGPALDSMPQQGLSQSRYGYISNLRNEINPVIAELAVMFGN